MVTNCEGVLQGAVQVPDLFIFTSIIISIIITSFFGSFLSNNLAFRELLLSFIWFGLRRIVAGVGGLLILTRDLLKLETCLPLFNSIDPIGSSKVVVDTAPFSGPRDWTHCYYK